MSVDFNNEKKTASMLPNYSLKYLAHYKVQRKWVTGIHKPGRPNAMPSILGTSSTSSSVRKQ